MKTEGTGDFVNRQLPLLIQTGSKRCGFLFRQKLQPVIASFDDHGTANDGITMTLRSIQNAKDKAMTEEELRTIVDVGKETGVIESWNICRTRNSIL